ncbi:MAG: hypothetical protein P4L92_06235 [Rudaea sp.]|nr:hypothetical protein [Rudaea sp.]
MTSRPTIVLPLLAAMAACTANAGDVYKCTSPQGSIAFQDQHCAAGDTEAMIHVAEPPAPSAPGEDSAAAPVGLNVSAPSTKPAADSSPVAQLPPLWMCTRPEDGTQYASRDGVTQPRMVPAGILGIPGQSLASAYGGQNNIGVSAPGLRKIPVNTSPQAAVAGDYVAIQDQCERATREQTCEYLQNQRDQIHEKLRRAFKDEQAVLQPRQDELDAELDGC